MLVALHYQRSLPWYTLLFSGRILHFRLSCVSQRGSKLENSGLLMKYSIGFVSPIKGLMTATSLVLSTTLSDHETFLIADFCKTVTLQISLHTPGEYPTNLLCLPWFSRLCRSLESVLCMSNVFFDLIACILLFSCSPSYVLSSSFNVQENEIF